MPKLAEEENTSRAEEQAARRRHLDLAHAKATEALDAHCGVLVRYINELRQVTLEAKSVAAAACTLVTREEKVRHNASESFDLPLQETLPFAS